MEYRNQDNWFAWTTDHVGVLDGIRTIAVLTVLWFHFWQQTWLMPYYPTPFLKWAGISTLDFNPIRRCGYLCVDLMILLSGFVLFLPYAKHHYEGTTVDRPATFYRKRIARIFPSYLVAVLVMFFVAYNAGAYANNTGFLWRDLLMHLTLTFMLRPDTYLFSSINGVFWTVVIEMLFYSIFPWIARWFEKRPIPTYFGMSAIGLAFTFGFCLKRSDTSFMVNRFLTFLPVFANGMVGAYIYVWFVRKAPIKPVLSVIGTAAACVSLWGILQLFTMCSSTQTIQVFQLSWRYPLSLAYLGLVLGISVSAKPIRFLLSNNVLRSISLVSYNLYLWHQFLIVRLKLALGCKTGADVAAMGVQTQWMLNMEALAISFFVAILATFCIEKPFHRWIMGRTFKNMQKQIDNGG